MESGDSIESFSLAHMLVSEIEEAGGRAIANSIDISSFDGAASVIESTVGTFGRIDVLVNCAPAIDRRRPIGETNEADFDEQCGSYVRAAMGMTKAALPHMQRQLGGSIINSGFGAFAALEDGFSLYATGQAAVVGLTNSAAAEGHSYGVVANVLSYEISLEEMWSSRSMDSRASGIGDWIFHESGQLSRILVHLADHSHNRVTSRCFLVDSKLNVSDIAAEAKRTIPVKPWTAAEIAAAIKGPEA
jgi:NAD(P)-dependent dehydrogenase (short-subunit alcohol dehydrogenase family)